MSADTGPTKPEAGVIATSPATAPEAAPSTVGLPRMTHSVNIQPSAAAAVAVFVTTNALVASLPADTALPAVKANQPNQKGAAPATVRGRGWGCMGSRPYPLRLPMTRAAAKAETPELM